MALQTHYNINTELKKKILSKNTCIICFKGSDLNVGTSNLKETAEPENMFHRIFDSRFLMMLAPNFC